MDQEGLTPSQVIVFSTLQDGVIVRHEAIVSNETWKRSLVGEGYLVVEHPSTSYVVAVTSEGFEAFPIDEDA